MKKIILIETVPDGLRTLKGYLNEINAQLAEFSSVSEVLASQETADLVILLANRDIKSFHNDFNALQSTPPFSKIPVLLIYPYDIPAAKPVDTAGLIKGSLPLSVEKLNFLSVVAQILNIPQRRVFKIIVSIQEVESNLIYSGISIDFSETGMAFECEADFSPHQALFVKFVNPASKKRLHLQSKIVRKGGGGAKTFYGVQFVGLKGEDSRELGRFIRGERDTASLLSPKTF